MPDLTMIAPVNGTLPAPAFRNAKTLCAEVVRHAADALLSLAELVEAIGDSPAGSDISEAGCLLADMADHLQGAPGDGESNLWLRWLRSES